MEWFLYDGDLRYERVNNSNLEAYLGPHQPCTIDFFREIRLCLLPV